MALKLAERHLSRVDRQSVYGANLYLIPIHRMTKVLVLESRHFSVKDAVMLGLLCYGQVEDEKEMSPGHRLGSVL